MDKLVNEIMFFRVFTYYQQCVAVSYLTDNNNETRNRLTRNWLAQIA